MHDPLKGFRFLFWFSIGICVGLIMLGWMMPSGQWR